MPRSTRFAVPRFPSPTGARGWPAAAALLVVALASPTTSTAWGPAGHRLVCEIAFQELTAGAKEEVNALIRKDPEFTTFSDSCNWPDQPRKRGEEHFINLPRSSTSVATTRCPLASKCTFTGLRDDRRVLERSWFASRKLRALEFLGHWVGDIHQPLHVSFQDDRGGNLIEESEEEPCDGNLHRVWDSCILAERVVKGRSIRKVAAELRATLDDGERSALRSSTAADWADESFRITIRDDVGYCFEIDEPEICAYDLDNPTLDFGEAQRGFTVDEAYLDLHGDRVAGRILAAGVRLGGLLNDIFDP